MGTKSTILTAVLSGKQNGGQQLLDIIDYIMSKYIPADKLIAEIERLKGLLIHGACAAQIEMETNCKDEAYNEVLSFITSLRQNELEYVRKDAVISIVKDYLENWLDSYRIERLIDKIEEL